MRTNILTLLVGFVLMCGLVLLFKVGLDKMTNAEAAPTEAFSQLNFDNNRRAFLYRVQPGDTLWSLSDRFYGNGHRWMEILRANDMAQGQGLQTGALIKIPLASSEATPQSEQAPAPAEPVVAEAKADPVVAAFADTATVDSIKASIDAKAYPDGVVCVARVTENQTVTLSVYDAAHPDSPAIAVYEGRRDAVLRDIRAEDFDGDGAQEICTIWQDEVSGVTSRIQRVEGNRLQLVCETPDDPSALIRLRQKQSK